MTTTTMEVMHAHARGEHFDRYEPGCAVCDRQFDRDVPVVDDPEPV